MVKLSPSQETKLRSFQMVAEERHLLKRQAEEEAEKLKARIFADWEERMTHHVTDLKREGVPNRRIGLAWGTKNQADAKRIVERFTTQVTEDAADPTTTHKQHAVVTGTRTQPLLTLNEWEVHADTPTVGDEPRTLTTQEFALRYREKTDTWLAVDTSDGVPLVLSRELMNRASELQSSIRTQVDALPDAQ